MFSQEQLKASRPLEDADQNFKKRSQYVCHQNFYGKQSHAATMASLCFHWVGSEETRWALVMEQTGLLCRSFLFFFFSSVCPLFLSRLGLICRSFFLLFLFIRFWTFMEAVMICSSFFFSNWLSIFKHEARCTYNEWPCWFVIYKLTKVFSLKIAKHVYGADKGTCEPQKHWTWVCIVLAFQGAGNILLIGFSLCFSSAPWLMHQCSSFCS